MSKRLNSNYPLEPKDLYPTPFKAVQPLIPHLDGIRRFAEACAGEGDLVRHLESFGLRCTYQGDIATGQDALELTSDDIANAPIITNPPYSRKSQPLLRRMIVHFQRIAPVTWLLLPSDFAHNQWFDPFLPSCTDIVAIGRVKWIEGTKRAGFENSAWYRFSARHSAGPVFHGNSKAAPRPSEARQCERCSRPYRPLRSDSRFCNASCRQRAHRERISRDTAVTDPGRK
jgi:hypothetical protein